MKKFAKHLDANQRSIVQGVKDYVALNARDIEDVELVMVDTHAVGGGFVDLVCGIRRNGGAGLTVLLEVKQPEHFIESKFHKRPQKRSGTLTPAEQAFHARWPGQPIVIVRTVEEALRALGID